MSSTQRRFPWQIVALIAAIGGALLLVNALFSGDVGGTWRTQTVQVGTLTATDRVYEPRERLGAQEALGLGVLALVGGAGYSIWRLRRRRGPDQGQER